MATATVNPTVNAPADDPYTSSMNAVPQSLERHYFGEVSIVDAYACVLIPGQGRVMFDKLQHAPEQRRNAVKLQIQVPNRDGGFYTLDQDVMDFSTEWLKFTLPSLRALNVTDLRNIRGWQVHVVRKQTGETYEKKKDGKPTGEMATRSAIYFLEVFPDRDARIAAADAFYTPRNGGGDAAPGNATTTSSVPVAAAPSLNDAERAFALKTLPTLWTLSGKDDDKYRQLIVQNAMVAKYFGPDSPEAQDAKQPLPF